MAYDGLILRNGTWYDDRTVRECLSHVPPADQPGLKRLARWRGASDEQRRNAFTRHKARQHARNLGLAK